MTPSTPPDPAAVGNPASAEHGLWNVAAPAELPEVLSGTNPLTAAANPLLNLIPQIRATPQHPNPARLRDYLVDQIQAFELRARAAGIAAETIIGTRYCLCTALDETAAQTPWGGSGAWSKNSLLVTFHNEVWGGEKFFQLLSKLAQNPQQHAHLLELMYYCLALGFEGRFRIVDNGRTQLETLKQRLVQIIHQNRGEYEHPLSPHWRGVPPTPRRPWENLPFWVTAAVAALLALGIYVWCLLALSTPADELNVAINSLRAPKVVAPPPVVAASPRLQRFLEPEIRERLVEVQDYADRSVVTLFGEGMFDSGSAVVKERYLPVLVRIAVALKDVAGPVEVAGHTDNQPIRAVRRIQFPTNAELSQGRADVVKRLIDDTLNMPGRVRAFGRGEHEPIASNDTAEGRARNRRVVITLFLAPGAPAATAPAAQQARP